MDTRILLARYQRGGLLPEAEAALLEVLADRGCAVETLENQNAAGIATPRVDEVVESHQKKKVSGTIWGRQRCA
ncbi:hypothetical protein B5P43_09005 [Bacillus sp. SRB_336]|nr:hypothetical protein B5P43_09005 [Bacillus sp. SRB_336]